MLQKSEMLQRQCCLLLIIVLSWIADKSYWSTAVVDAQGPPPRLSITRRPSNTLAIHVISDGLSLPRNKDDAPSPSTTISIEPASSSLPSAMPTGLVQVPELTANPSTASKEDSPSSFPTGAPVSIPLNVPPVASPSSTNPPTSPTPTSMYPSIFPTKEPTSTTSNSSIQYPTLDPMKVPSSIPTSITSDSSSAMPSSIISPTVVAPNTQPTSSTVVQAVDSESAVDQVLLKTTKVGIMNAEQVSNFEHVCETDFLPIYLHKVYPSANYTNITCTIMSQSVFESTTSGVPGDIILAVLLRIQSNVNLLTKSSPSFDDIVAEVVSSYTAQLQELLIQSSSNPDETYFVDTTTNDTESSSKDNNNHRPVVAIIASTMSVAFIILGLALIVMSRKRYHQKGGKGKKSETIKGIRMENQSSSGDDSLYNEEQQKAATINAYQLDHQHDVYDYDNNVGLDVVEPAMIYEKMSLTSHRSQHERRTYNMSFIGLSSTTSGVSSVTNTPSSFGTNSTTMASILQSPTSAAAKRATTNSSPSNNGGCSPGLIIPPTVERLYYETLHSTLRLAKMDSSSGISITTSLSSQKRRGELYSQMDDDDNESDEDDDDDTMNSTDEPAKPLPSLIVAITESQQDESKTKSKITSTTGSSSSTRRRSGAGGGNQNNNMTGETSLKERESTNPPPANSSRRSSSSRCSSRSQKGKRSQRGRQRRTSPLTPSRRGGGGKEHNDDKNNKNNSHDCDDDDDKFRMYSHTSAEEMMTDDDDDDTKMDAKLPSVIITITQQEVIKSTRMMPAADQQDEDISSSSLLPVLGIISRPYPPNEQTTTSRPFSSRSMCINSSINSALHHGEGGGGEIIQSVETELSSVSASVGTMTRDGSSSSRDSTNDSSSSNSNDDNAAAANSSSNRKSDDDNQRGRNDRNSRNRIVNI